MGFLSSVVGDVFGGLTGGEGALLGGLGSGALGLLGGSMQNSAAAAQATQAENFSENMADTSYQRTVDSMRAAGLNPALAYQNGPVGQPTGVAAPVQNVMSGAVNSAQSGVSAGQQVAMMQSNIDLNKANAASAIANAANSAASAGIKAPESKVLQSFANAMPSNPVSSAWDATTDWIGQKYANVFGPK